jgi:ADP-ribosylglycohydrolase
MTPSLKDRYLGSLVGLACGDAVGTAVEFSPRGSFALVRGMTGGGAFGLAAGKWTDDTSMALCLAESLIEKSGFDAQDQMTRYLNWWRLGYLSSTGECFDIGGTTLAALSRFEQSGDPYSGSTSPRAAGNGSIMRLAPVVLYFHPTLERVIRYSAESSRTTHAAPEALDCCRLLACVLVRALKGHHKSDLLDDSLAFLAEASVREIAKGSFTTKDAAFIRGSGYCVESLEAALWCVHNTASFEDAVLAAANLGDDADTTAAVVGQIAGALYGIDGIPAEWKRTLHMGDEIAEMARQIHEAATVNA